MRPHPRPSDASRRGGARTAGEDGDFFYIVDSGSLDALVPASIKLGQQFSDINSSDPILRMRDGAAAECGNPDFTLGASANFWEGVRAGPAACGG